MSGVGSNSLNLSAPIQDRLDRWKARHRPGSTTMTTRAAFSSPIVKRESTASPAKALPLPFDGWTRINTNATWGDKAIRTVNSLIWLLAIGVSLWAIYIYTGGSDANKELFTQIGHALKWTVISTCSLALMRAAYSAIQTATAGHGVKETAADFAGTTVTLIFMPLVDLFKYAGELCCRAIPSMIRC